jgi:predicted CXXCH cytochrome family protein
MRGRRTLLFLLLFSWSLIFSIASFAATVGNDECLGCHGSQDILKMTKEEKLGMVAPAPGKKEVPKGSLTLHVDGKRFDSSVHGKLTCVSCHSEIKEIPHSERLALVNCGKCHIKAMKEYEKSTHAMKSGGLCFECHNPHETGSLKNLSLDQRNAICLQCHEKGGHAWLPQRDLHFTSLACNTCHSPEAKKGLSLYVATAERVPFTYDQLKGFARQNKGDVAKAIDGNGNKVIELNEMKTFIDELKKGGLQPPRLKVEGLVTGPSHNFTGQVKEAKDCTLCHNPKIAFYSQVMLKVPQREGWQHISVEKKVIEKMEVIPARENYFTTIHEKKGVKCIECHAYQTVLREGVDFKLENMKELVCGTRCHKEIMDEYKASLHYKVHQSFCLDCHEPHPNVPFVQLDAKQRRAICLKCHKDTDRQHQWQTQQTLHCNYVECTMCHSPQAKKGMVFYLRAINGQGREKRLSYRDIAELLKTDKPDVAKLLDSDKDGSLDEKEILSFLSSLNSSGVLKEKDWRRIDLGMNLLVLKPFHDYTERLKKAKDCSLCHSSKAEGLAGLVLQIPEDKDELETMPVEKEALIRFLPLPGTGNFYLLGERGISKEDLSLLWRGDLVHGIRILIYKWTDALGFFFLFGAIGFVGIHSAIRILTRRLRAEKKHLKDE